MHVLIPVLVFVAVVSIGAAVVLMVRMRRRPITSRILGDTVAATPEEQHHRMVSVLRRFGNAFSFGRSSSALKAQLSRAGFYSDGAASVYMGVKLSLLALGLTSAIVLVGPSGLHVALKIYLIIFGAAMLLGKSDKMLHGGGALMRCVSTRRGP